MLGQAQSNRQITLSLVATRQHQQKFCIYSSQVHMPCMSFSAASNAVLEGILLLLLECLGFLLTK